MTTEPPLIEKKDFSSLLRSAPLNSLHIHNTSTLFPHRSSYKPLSWEAQLPISMLLLLRLSNPPRSSFSLQQQNHARDSLLYQKRCEFRGPKSMPPPRSNERTIYKKGRPLLVGLPRVCRTSVARVNNRGKDMSRPVPITPPPNKVPGVSLMAFLVGPPTCRERTQESRTLRVHCAETMRRK